MKPFTKEEAYNWAATRCAQKEYCRMELMQKFVQRGLSRPDCEEVLEKLEREGFVDEARYARAFVHDKTLYNHWGRMKTRQALAIKNISNEHIEQALGRFSVSRDGRRLTENTRHERIGHSIPLRHPILLSFRHIYKKEQQICFLSTSSKRKRKFIP